MPIAGLEYIIKLNDQISEPLKAIKGKIDTIGEAGKAAMIKIGAGAAGLAATGASLYAAMTPAIEMSNALSQITATGMSDASLSKVEKFALGFSSSFGVSAVEVVNSANEIVRAIDGLTDDEVIAFTRSSNLLAKATDSSVQEMGSYLGTMYGIFQEEADKMGKAKWIEQMSGQATLTANMFKSSGESLSQAFTNLMATGTAHGVAMAEQFAVLGNLQGVMPGGQSGTKYAAFLDGVVKAQKKLGLQFLDSQNKMLPITDILEKIKAKYGDLDSKELDLIGEAFGSKNAAQVVAHLITKTDTLKGNIKQIGDVSNLDDAAKTAKIVTSVWDRLGNVFTNIRTAIGAPVLKKITPFFEKLADMGASFAEWLGTYKNIARWIGYIVGGLMALTAIVPLIMLTIGLFKIWKVAAIALKLPLVGLGGVSKGVFGGMAGSFTNLIKLGSPFKLLFIGLKKAIFTLFAPIKSLLSIFKSVFLFLKSGLFSVIAGIKGLFWALTHPLIALKAISSTLWTGFLTGIKLLFSPLSLWIGLFVGLGVLIYSFKDEIKTFFSGVVKGFKEWGISFEPVKAGLGRIWDALKRIFNVFSSLFGVTEASQQSLNSWSAVGQVVGGALAWTFQTVLDTVELVATLIEGVADIFEEVSWIIIGAWQEVLAAWGNNDIWGVFSAIGNGIANIFTAVFKGVRDMFFRFLNWLIDKINSIGQYVGLEIPKIQMEVDQAIGPPPDLAAPALGVANMAMQMANTQAMTPKPDASGQVYALGNAQPKKFDKSPQLGKNIATQNNQQYITIQKIEVKDGADLERRLERRQKEAQHLQ